MSPIEYLIEAFTSWPTFLIILVISAPLYFILCRRVTFGLLDPAFIVLMPDSIGWALVATMFLRGDIKAAYFVGFAACQLAFILGLLTLQKSYSVPPSVQQRAGLPDRGLAIVVFLTAWSINLFSTLTTWALAGVPVFRASRLGAFYGSGGLGILERLSSGTGDIAIFAAACIWIAGRRSAALSGLIMVFALWMLTSLTLSGSKAGLLGVGQSIFAAYICFSVIRSRKESFYGGRLGLPFIAIASVFALAILWLKQTDDGPSPLVALAFRLINYADIYIYAYLNNLVENLRGDSALLGMFGGLLGNLRILPTDLIHENIGLQLFRMVFPDASYIAGPNPRLAVFGYHYFGTMAFLFSYAVGVATRILQTNLYNNVHRGFLATLLAFQLYFTLVFMNVDFSYAVSKLTTVAISLFSVLIIALPIYYAGSKPVLTYR